MLEYQLTDLVPTGCREIKLLVLNAAWRKKRMNQNNIVINSPLSVRKGTRGYYKYKFKQACAQLVNNETSINIEKVPGLLKVRKVKSKDLPEKKTIQVTQVCGSMTGKWLLDTVKEIQLKA